jgi:hypothetical protein
MANPAVGGREIDRVLGSVAHQAAVLAGRPEFHLLGNHLLENAITLCWCGLSIDHPSAPGWLLAGERLLRREVETQVLPDGSHDERSPMYQALLAEALLRLASVASASPAPGAGAIHARADRAGRDLVRSLDLLTHPDGEVALLNDSAFGIAPPVEALRRRFGIKAESGHQESWALRDAGYAGVRSNGTSVVFDGGPLGPDWQPGHGHADLLSFELSHQGRRVVTDTGVFTYAEGPIRAADRGTAAHNCVQVDGGDQAELWAAFRCGRRPRAATVGVDTTGASAALSGACSFSLDGGPAIAQSRRMTVSGNTLSIADEVAAPGFHDLTARLHLAPGLRATRTASGWTVLDGAARVMDVVGSTLEWVEDSSPYHPEFGKEIARICLVARAGMRDRHRSEWTLVLA